MLCAEWTQSPQLLIPEVKPATPPLPHPRHPAWHETGFPALGKASWSNPVFWPLGTFVSMEIQGFEHRSSTTSEIMESIVVMVALRNAAVDLTSALSSANAG